MYSDMNGIGYVQYFCCEVQVFQTGSDTIVWNLFKKLGVLDM